MGADSKKSNKKSPLHSSPLNILLAFTLFACLFLYFSTCPFRFVGLKTPSSIQRMESDELAKLLNKASTEDRTVIMATVDKGLSASILDLFLESFEVGENTRDLVKHLLIIAMDSKALEKCNFVHQHCYFLRTKVVHFDSEDELEEIDYVKMMWRRVEFQRLILELGYNFVSTDLDIMWLRNPFGHIAGSPYLSTLKNDVFSDDFTNMSKNWMNGGFISVISTTSSIDFYKYWYMAKFLYPNLHAMSIFNKINQDSNAQMMQLSIAVLDSSYFGEICDPSKDISRVLTMDAKCCGGANEKVDELRVLIEDWKRYMRLKEEGRRDDFYWRVPIQCKA